ncbi:hypothetical protein DQ237_10420 [Blastococcus sp. TF02-8]|uniref:glycosyltransferase family 4 protein n=1 Tax=Blastococcus sp. TF02-8 TaxID=2250574 RepID=UPI000DEB3B78|nr:glycosyltransferase family 4 protein [Blastococcus sp. TF02-8]RBY96265.1 hypothetical protein DQ237_10420 [Blastococcus sp. TF02-8]
MRVMYVDHTAKLSGGEIALARLLPAVARDVTALVVLGEDGPLVTRLRNLGVEVIILPLSAFSRDVRKDSLSSPLAALSRVYSVLSYSLKLRKLIRQRRIDVVHTNSLKSGFYGCIAARMACVPSVWHLRDRLAADYLPWFGLVVARLAIAVLPTRIVCNSSATMATLPRGARTGQRRRPLVVPSPLYDVLEPVPPTGTSIHGSRGPTSGDEPFIVGLVGRFAPWKGQLEAVRAFAVADMPETARLVLVGSPMFGEEEYESRVRQEVARLGLTDRVDFRGFVEDVSRELMNVDVLLHASTVPEPLGQVILEGMAAGVPVLATRGGGPSEIISEGVNGILYTPGDSAEIARQVNRLWQDEELRQRLRQEGLRRAGDFSPEVIAPKVLALYRDMVAEHGRSAA